jgi:hypothetical protein
VLQHRRRRSHAASRQQRRSIRTPKPVYDRLHSGLAFRKMNLPGPPSALLSSDDLDALHGVDDIRFDLIVVPSGN